ncbi:MAG: hypothetical protein HY674_22905 [Chloroflexi bacterium]|nr:hypothetical protein [Chloroflexota bacterium]
MSWIQFQGEIWPATNGEADLRVHVLPPDVGCPRVSWSLDLFQFIEAKEPLPGRPKMERWINVELTNFTVPERDWRRLSHLEIRADPAWQTAQEFIGPYGHSHHLPKVEVSVTVMHLYADKQEDAGRFCWIAHDFMLRFGTRDGWAFPCELDAWMIPAEEYYRKTPETREEAARFAAGPPNLRVLTRAQFVGGTIELARCGPDPLPTARRMLREQTGCEELFQTEAKWWLRHTPDHKEIVPVPVGWRSSVNFATAPAKSPTAAA